METNKMILRLKKAFFKEVEEYALMHPKDIGLLYDSYKELKKQEFSGDFLDGYLATINDLIIIKKGHWGVAPNKLRQQETLGVLKSFYEDTCEQYITREEPNQLTVEMILSAMKRLIEEFTQPQKKQE